MILTNNITAIQENNPYLTTLQENKRLELNYFDTATIDRMSEHRKKETWLKEQLQNPSARIIPVWQNMHLVSVKENEPPTAIFLSYEQWQSLHGDIAPEILLGKDKENDFLYFAVELQELDSQAQAHYSRLGEFQSLRNMSLLINRHQGALLAYAQGMTFWHHNHRFCGKCGAPTRNIEGGHVRICTSEKCKSQHFPRTDPAVIVLVSTGDYCLLGRNSNWHKKMYSTIAGFVEPGESLEMTVIREVLEETGVKIDPGHITYHSSQPWPFPASIMLGFTARTTRQEIHVDTLELEDARWFSRTDIETALQSDAFCLPSKYSIAYRLIEDWRLQK